MDRLVSAKGRKMPEFEPEYEKSSLSEEARKSSQPRRLFQSSMKAVRDRIRQHAVQTGDWPPPNAIFGNKHSGDKGPKAGPSKAFTRPASANITGAAAKRDKGITTNREKPAKDKRSKGGSRKKPANLHAMIANFREGPAPDQSKLPILIESADGGFICPGTDVNTIIEGFMEFERHFKRGGLLPFANIMPISSVKSNQNSLDLSTDDDYVDSGGGDVDVERDPIEAVVDVTSASGDLSTPPTSGIISSLKTSSTSGTSPTNRVSTTTTKKQVTFDYDSLPHKRKSAGVRLKEPIHYLPKESPVQKTSTTFSTKSTDTESDISPIMETAIVVPLGKSVPESCTKVNRITSSNDSNDIVTVECTPEENMDNIASLVPASPPEEEVKESSPPTVTTNGDKIKGESLDPNEIGDAIQKCLENLRLASDGYGALMMGAKERSKGGDSRQKHRTKVIDTSEHSGTGGTRGTWRRFLCLRHEKREPPSC